MLLQQAEDFVQRLLNPLTLDEFLDGIVGKRFVKVDGAAHKERRGSLLGADPRQVLLDSFERLAPKIGCHAAAPTGPPPNIEPVPDAASFGAKIAAFHARGYTVRLPDIRALTPELDRFIRALECVFLQPVKVEAFWSRGDAKAPPHHDDYDIIVVHLLGNKRWFISSLASDLPNAWGDPPGAPARVERFTEVQVGPGDFLYLPRGTKHRVDAISESIHLSIGFVPLTLREAVIACLDHLSDLERSLRETVGARAGAQTQASDFADIPERIRGAVASLVSHCQRDGFVEFALQHRASRVIRGLDRLSAPADRKPLSPVTRVRHNPLAICHRLANGNRIDFAYPGGHELIHAGAEECVRFLANTPEFFIRDIPGAIGNDVRVALVEKFVSRGLLEIMSD